MHRTPAVLNKKILWNFVEENLVFDLRTVARLASECRHTKRNSAAVAAKFYDLIGFISLVVVQFKPFFQDLCSSGRDIGRISLQNSQPLRLERCYFKEPRNEIVCCNLHGFCDACLKAYGAVVYLQVHTASRTYVKFVASKTSVTKQSPDWNF